MLLDFRRFCRDSITDFANLQVDILRSHKVVGKITTNAPGGSWSKAIDHNRVFERMNFPAYDNYPVWGGSTSAPLPSTVALALDQVRGWSSGGDTYSHPLLTSGFYIPSDVDVTSTTMLKIRIS